MALRLTEIARKTLSSYFEKKKFDLDDKTKKSFSKKGASFVTLTKKGELRGCVGSLEPSRELWKDIQENAINAGIYDPRFPPITKEEFEGIQIEVSVLSISKIMKFENPDDLLKKINNKMGIILKKGMRSATFLPQVWEELPDKKQFLEHLSMRREQKKEN